MSPQPQHRKAFVPANTAQLPPLILHPFSENNSVNDLMEGSRASMALQGLVASAEEEAALCRRMLGGRYQEVRMLLFLGKDIFRWMEQCLEVMRSGNGDDIGIAVQSFPSLSSRTRRNK